MGMLSVIKEAPKAVVRAFGKGLFALDKAKPQIMVVGGVLIATGAFITVIVNARKMDAVMEEGTAKVADIEHRMAEAADPQNNLTEEEKQTIITVCSKELRKAKRDNILKMFTLIGVPSVAFAGGIALTIGGHVILVKRFGQLSVAFSALKESFDKYRALNIREHGEDCDRRYIYGIVDEQEMETTITDENGKEQKVKCLIPVVDQDQAAGMYTFEFSERTSRKCQRDPVNNISFLKSQENFWNIFMQGKGRPVTLNMILDEIGIEWDPDDPEQDYILRAGWRPNGDGDNRIDFGIMRAVNRSALALESNVIMLNFNCDGDLYHSARYDKNGQKIC